MLAGLLFAIADAEDRPGRLAATLPFGGLTLIEYQARSLIAAGAAQVIVVVARMTPELLGALNRIGRRGVAVDAVRTASEAAAKLHPLGRAMMLADGLVTTDEAIAALSGGRGDALLVLPAADATGDWERVGGQMAWAGIARIDPKRVMELAALPADYDVQSTLLRLADQAGAAHVQLPAAAVRHGHGIEHRAAALAARGRLVLASLVGGRRGWFDRWVLGPIARAALPLMVERGVSGLAVGGAGGGLALIGLVTIWFGVTNWGTALAFVATLVLALGTTLSELRDEYGVERAQRLATAAVPALAAAAIGMAEWRMGTAAPLAVALAGIAAGALAERAAAEEARRGWWATPPAGLLIVLIGALAGAAPVGLAVAAIYAWATLAAAIEALRRHA